MGTLVRLAGATQTGEVFERQEITRMAIGIYFDSYFSNFSSQPFVFVSKITIFVVRY